MNRLYERVVTATRQIRRYSARGPGREKGPFTFPFEIDALCELRNTRPHGDSSDSLRKSFSDDEFDLGRQQWPIKKVEWFRILSLVAPVLYGRYRQGCALLEAALNLQFEQRKWRSYDMLFRIFNGDEEPNGRCLVTLTHYYARLGKDLLEWPHWESFVCQLHARLFKLAGCGARRYSGDPRRLGDS